LKLGGECAKESGQRCWSAISLVKASKFQGSSRSIEYGLL
jgi:hypothetical protein